MDFSFTDEQLAIRDAVARYGAERLAPGYRRREQEGFEPGLIEEMGSLGYIAPEMPEELGGAGLDAVTAGLPGAPHARRDLISDHGGAALVTRPWAGAPSSCSAAPRPVSGCRRGRTCRSPG